VGECLFSWLYHSKVKRFLQINIGSIIYNLFLCLFDKQVADNYRGDKIKYDQTDDNPSGLGQILDDSFLNEP
jgi:hypothetical protein